jgi:hypothetical protein
MVKRQKQIYNFLTLFKQDIRELVQLFQNNLHDVEVVVDDLHIFDITQLDQFDQAYQAKSLLARGYSSELVEEDPKLQGERLLIELKINNVSATLLGWKEDGRAEPDILMQIRTVLLRRQNHVHEFIVTVGNWMLLYLFLSLLPPLQQHHVNFILQIFLIVGSGILLALVAFFLFAFIIRRLKIETLVFLLPGATSSTKVYGRREAVGRLFVDLILLIVIGGGCIFALHLLWR